MKTFKVKMLAMSLVLVVVSCTIGLMVANVVDSGQVDFASTGFSYRQLCRQVFLGEPKEGPVVYRKAHTENVRKLEEMETLTLSGYNVENELLHERTRSDGTKEEFIDKPEEDQQGVADTTNRINADLMVRVEVDHQRTLELENKTRLHNQYDSLLIEGNDQREIDIGYNIKKDLPLDIEVQSHKNQIDENGNKVHSRDLPALIARIPGDPKPLFIIIGIHFKSQRAYGDGGKDPTGSIKRTQQAKAAAELAKHYAELYGPEVPIFAIGDFNINIPTSPEFKPFWDAGFKDTFSLGANPARGDDLITETFHSKDGKTFKSQLDGILVMNFSKPEELIEESHPVGYLDANGNPMPLPDSFEARKKQPSDHRATVAKLRLRYLLSLRGH